MQEASSHLKLNRGEREAALVRWLVLGSVLLLAGVMARSAEAAPPKVTMTSPAPSELVNVRPDTPPSVTVIAKIEASGSPLAAVEVLLDERPLAQREPVVSPRGGLVSIVVPASLGTHKLAVRATNAAGESALSETASVTINQAPLVSLIGPVANRGRESTASRERAADAQPPGPAEKKIAVQIMAHDRDGTLSSVQLFSEGVLIGNAVPVLATNGGPTRYWTVDWPAPVPGNYKLVARATDNHGAISESASASFPIGLRSDAPRIFGEAPSNVTTASQTPAMRVSIAGEASRIDPEKTRVFVDGQDVTSTVSARDGHLFWQPERPLDPGAHRVRVEVADMEGRRAEKDWQFNIALAPAPTTNSAARGELATAPVPGIRVPKP